MIDAELLDDVSATMRWLNSFDDTPYTFSAAHARYVLLRLLDEHESSP